jgi:hypothetical protein
MVSLRFPFIFSNPKPPQNPRPFSKFTAAAAAAGATAAFVAVSSNDRHRLFLQNALNSLISSDNNFPLWGCLSLADSGVPIVDSRTGSSFPSVLEASQKLCGIGLRKKCILGLKNIDVYAFGKLLNKKKSFFFCLIILLINISVSLKFFLILVLLLIL